MTPNELMNALVLRVRTEFEIDLRVRRIELTGQEAAPTIATSHGDLLVEVVSDGAGTISMPAKRDLAEIGVSEDEAIRIAAAKLRRHTDADQWEPVDDMIWLSRYQDDYDFARLVAAGDDCRLPLEGVPIVFAPSHAICLLTMSTDDDVLARMTDIGNEAAADHRPFSQLLWTPGPDGGWQCWQPDESGTAASQAIRESVSRYEETKDYLEQTTDGDVFIATYQAVQSDDQLWSYCTYTFDLPSYLPQTDFVAIVDSELPDDEAIVGRVDWAEFVDVLGSDSIERIEGMEPAWFRIVDQLPEDRRERLSNLARPLV